MTGNHAPTLDELARAQQPAWLWDVERLRVVWANRAGIAHWGGETLFDLLDRRFSTADAGVAKLVSVFKALGPEETQQANLAFAGARTVTPLRCRCTRQALTDGRPGLLVVSTRTAQEQEDAAARLGAGVLDALPSAVVVVTGAGNIVHLNRAARETWAGRLPDTLSRLIGDDGLAEDLLEQAAAGGVVSEVAGLETRYGLRQNRIYLDALPGAPGCEPLYAATFDDITERRAHEREMRADLDRLTDFVAAAASFTWELDAELSFKQLSQGFSEVTGIEAQEILGESWTEVARRFGIDRQGAIARAIEARDAWQTEVVWHDGDRRIATSLSAVPQVAADGSFAGYTGIGAAPAGHGAAPETVARPLQAGGDAAASASTFSDEDMATFEEIASRLGSDEPQEAPEPDAPEPKPPLTVYAGPSDDELRAILDTATDGILTFDRSGRIISLNASAQAIFGLDTPEAVGRQIYELLTPESAKTVRDYVAALSDSGLASIFNDGREVVACESQGGEIPLFLTIGRVAAQDGGAGAAPVFCAVIRDITQWKRSELELRRAKDAAEQANAQKSEFLANISHELRTPLNAIIGFSEVMQTEKFGPISNEKYKGYVTDIHSSGEHLLSLINDLLDLSKVEAGKLELNFTSVDLAAVVQQAIGIIQPQATRERIIVRTSIAESLPNVVADGRSMRQVVLNLLSNAVKFTDPGGQVIVSAMLDAEGRVKLRVKDTGIGMSAQELAQAMQPFTRIERSDREGPVGTGLGLPLTKALAEANRASFEIQSKPGEGTRVEITFPTTRVLAD